MKDCDTLKEWKLSNGLGLVPVQDGNKGGSWTHLFLQAPNLHLHTEEFPLEGI